MYLVLFFAATALLSDSCRSANINNRNTLLSDDIDVNRFRNNEMKPKPQSFNRLVITKKPMPAYTLIPGTTLTLTCAAMGSPAPSFRWFRNDKPVYEFNKESSESIDSSPTSFGHLTSSLLVSRATERDEYSCLAVSGSKTVRVTTVVSSPGGSTELSEREKLSPLKPRIVVSYISLLDNMGLNVTLPCRAKSHPRPRVVWIDNNKEIVKNDERRKVLRSGEMIISSLLWSDMGEYTCIAYNMFGSDTAKTFLYPAKID